MPNFDVAPEDASRGAQHADDAEECLSRATSVPLEILLRAAAHAGLAVYYELRAQR